MVMENMAAPQPSWFAASEQVLEPTELRSFRVSQPWSRETRKLLSPVSTSPEGSELGVDGLGEPRLPEHRRRSSAFSPFAATRP
jgi:hypothetical protein